MDSSPLNGIDVPDWKSKPPVKRKEESTMNVTQIGIDLAKQVFQVHGVDRRGWNAAQSGNQDDGLDPRNPALRAPSGLREMQGGNGVRARAEE